MGNYVTIIVALLLYKISISGAGKQLINPPGCGAIPVHARMLGGTYAALGSNPWLALIIFEGQDFPTSRLGALINHRYVVTTASALHRHVDFVRLGEYNSCTDPDCDGRLCSDPARDYQVDKVIVGSETPTFEKDIALLKLKEEVEFTEWVYPICICERFVPSKLSFSGWKAAALGIEKKFELKETEVIAVDPEKCMGVINVTNNCHICTRAPFDIHYNLYDIGSPLVLQQGSDKKGRFCVASLLQKTDFKRTNPSHVLSCSLDWLKDNLK